MRFLFFLFTWTHPNLWVNADIFSLILVLAPINNFLSPKVIIVLNPVYSLLIIPVNEASLLTQTVDVAVMYTKGMVSRTRNRRQSHSCFVDLPRQLIYIMRENAFSFQYSFVQFDKKFTCTYINRFDIQDFDHHAVENGNSTIIYRKTSYRLAPVSCGSNCNTNLTCCNGMFWKTSCFVSTAMRYQMLTHTYTPAEPKSNMDRLKLVMMPVKRAL